jgi:hypothetical protein
MSKRKSMKVLIIVSCIALAVTGLVVKFWDNIKSLFGPKWKME